MRAVGGPPPIRLLTGGDVVWEPTWPAASVGEWLTVPLPPVAPDLKFDVGLRVVDLKETRAHAIAFVGPIRWSSCPIDDPRKM